MSTSRLRTMIALIRLGRPLFLVGGFVMFALGAAIAHATGHPLDAGRYALGQAVVTAFQLMTHYANDYYDYECDRANPTPTRFSGGSRVLPAGELPRRAALVAAIVLAALGVVAAIVIAVALPAAITHTALPIIAAMAALAWSYSAPPARLCARGAGEATTAIVVTALVPLLGFALFAPGLAGGRVVAVAIAPLVALQIAMLLAIELPDAAGDAATGKRTLVVRLGARGATGLQIALLAGAGGAIVAMPALGLPPVVAAFAAAYLPFGAWQIARVARGYADPARWERIALWAVAILTGTAAAELVGFALAR